MPSIILLLNRVGASKSNTICVVLDDLIIDMINTYARMLEIISPVQNGKKSENISQTYLDSFWKGIKISLNIVETPYFI